MKFDGPYCLLHRDGKAYYATGQIVRTKLLAELPRAQALPVIAMVPYSQLRERGFPVHDGDESILALVCSEYRQVELADLTGPAWNVPAQLAGPMRFNMSDEEFMATVEAVIAQEIRAGEGSNFLLSRKGRVALAEFGSATANSIFRRFVQNEVGSYMTFCFFDGQHYFIGSSPERHITIESGRVRMNPICGTLPKAALRSRADLLDFFSDQKEINELFQVVDEELKMMSRICRAGGELLGPFVKEMSTLIHTEYVLEGETDMDNIDAFRASMFAATMIGSPLENAARVIKKHERESRRYYSSALLLLERNAQGREDLDSAITIRTMEISAQGECTIQAGASIVRDSVPIKECQEIKAKAEAAVRALTSGQPGTCALSDFYDEMAAQCLSSRNAQLSRFWMKKQARTYVQPALEGKRALIVDNEDDFTHMLKHAFEHLGLSVIVKDYDAPGLSVSGFDLVVVGPGPGDPTNMQDPKMRIVHDMVQALLDSKTRFLAVCLGHQILCHRLGLSIERSDPPLQGVQKAVPYFDRSEVVGFYNTFFALAPSQALPPGVELTAAPDGRVIATRSSHFWSFQFHVESVLTTNGLQVLNEAITHVLG